MVLELTGSHVSVNQYGVHAVKNDKKMWNKASSNMQLSHPIIFNHSNRVPWTPFHFISYHSKPLPQPIKNSFTKNVKQQRTNFCGKEVISVFLVCLFTVITQNALPAHRVLGNADASGTEGVHGWQIFQLFNRGVSALALLCHFGSSQTARRGMATVFRRGRDRQGTGWIGLVDFLGHVRTVHNEVKVKGGEGGGSQSKDRDQQRRWPPKPRPPHSPIRGGWGAKQGSKRETIKKKKKKSNLVSSAD